MRRPLVLAALIAGLAGSRAQAAQLPGDSLHILEAARAAQSRYEAVRLRHLPLTWSRSGSARDEVVGRIALIDDADLMEWRPVPDPPSVAAARASLLEALADGAEDLPGDEWIAGQRVFYLLEAGRTAEALEAARACRQEGWWCRALQGWALHAGADFTAAESAFGEALARMPAGERRRWSDPGPTLDREARRLLEDAGDGSRSELERRAWWLADPLWSQPGNDRLTEHYARHVLNRVLEDARNPFRLSWGTDLSEVLIRYGWPVGWERTRPRTWALGRTGGEGVIGRDPPNERRFVPDAAMLARPAESEPAIGTLEDEGARSTYAPAYAERFLDLNHQLAVFRRGGSALLVAGWSLPADSLPAGARVEAALVVAQAPDDPARAARSPSSGSEGVLVLEAPWEPAVVSVEALARGAGLAARARYGAPISGPVDARPAISDLLLVDPAEPGPDSLTEAIPRTRPTTRVRPGEAVGLYWEVYPPGGGSYEARFSLRLRDEGGGFWHGLGAALGLADRRGGSTALEWSELLPAAGVAPRSLVLTLPALPAGTYWLELEATLPDSRRAGAVREILVE